jgi:hypothetical protein
MGLTHKSKKLHLLKQKLTNQSPRLRTFATDYNALHAILATRTLSLPNCRFCSKAIAVLRSRYSAVEHGDLIDHLEAKLATSFQRVRDRAAGREAAKQKKRGPKPLVTLPPLPAIEDPWNAIDTSFLEIDLDSEPGAIVKAEPK